MNIIQKGANILFPIIRIALAVSWFYQGWFKLQANFDISGLVPSVLMNTDSPDWYKAFMEHVVGPYTGIFNILIPWGELLVGLGLITGILVYPALISGIFMGINYWLADMIYIYPVQLATAILLMLAINQTKHLSVESLIRRKKHAENRI